MADEDLCISRKIDSNITGLSYAEEECLKKLPDSPVWKGLSPNSYSDFGGELSTIASAPIDPSRQNKRGTVTDLEASGGFNLDVSPDNLTDLMQGFCFADARETPTTKPLNGAAGLITSVSVDDGFSATGIALDALFTVGDLVKGSGFMNPINNGLKTAIDTSSGFLDVTEPLVNETPTSAAALTKVGFQFPSGDVALEIVGGIPQLTSDVTDFTTVADLIAGKWLFLGGDVLTNRFTDNVGFVRVKNVSANVITFDDITFKPVAESGAGKAIRIFTGTVVKNEKEGQLIKRRSYNIERTLGIGDFGEPQAEYLEGAVANEFTLNVPTTEKMSADMSFVACDNTHRSGDVNDKIKDGVRIPTVAPAIMNTSTDVYRIKMNVLDPLTSSPTALFGYVSEATVTINNSVTGVKAIGVLGSFDTSAGNFEVGGSVTAYFTNTSAIRAVRNNADVGFNIIAASNNAGFIFDIPLLGLGGGRLSVEKDSPITVPLEPAGAENPNGYTLLYQTFPYLPDIAMPL